MEFISRMKQLLIPTRCCLPVLFQLGVPCSPRGFKGPTHPMSQTMATATWVYLRLNCPSHILLEQGLPSGPHLRPPFLLELAPRLFQRLLNSSFLRLGTLFLGETMACCLVWQSSKCLGGLLLALRRSPHPAPRWGAQALHSTMALSTRLSIALRLGGLIGTPPLPPPFYP